VKVVFALGGLVAVLAASGTAGGASSPRCHGIQLGGTFTGVPNSAGAGNIVYRLALHNVSSSTCTLTGLPQGALLIGANGARLPTHIRTAVAGQAAVLVRLAPGKIAYANARFSPDVAGTGDEMSGRCEPVASWLQVEGINVQITRPTSVCERGTLSFTNYSPKKS
jgi:Domain of unknown function (DUF4232)